MYKGLYRRLCCVPKGRIFTLVKGIARRNSSTSTLSHPLSTAWERDCMGSFCSTGVKEMEGDAVRSHDSTFISSFISYIPSPHFFVSVITLQKSHQRHKMERSELISQHDHHTRALARPARSLAASIRLCGDHENSGSPVVSGNLRDASKEPGKVCTLPR